MIVCYLKPIVGYDGIVSNRMDFLYDVSVKVS